MSHTSALDRTTFVTDVLVALVMLDDEVEKAIVRLDDASVLPEDVFRENGILPALALEADRLSRAIFGWSLAPKVSFTDQESLIGVLLEDWGKAPLSVLLPCLRFALMRQRAEDGVFQFGPLARRWGNSVAALAKVSPGVTAAPTAGL